MSIDKSLTYYLSGPMSGYPEFNFPAFAAAAEWCSRHGVMVVNPALVVHHEPNGLGSAAFGDYLADDLAEALALGCRGIILLPGWPQSKGARVELGLALALSWPAYYLMSTGRTARSLVDMNRRLP
jgi:hypothetical protein